MEGGLELSRAGKVALNMLARGLWATKRDRDTTVLSIHPGRVNTDMGMLSGTVAAGTELSPGVRGVADVVDRFKAQARKLISIGRASPIAC